MRFKFSPTGTNVVVRRVENTETKSGLLFIPTMAAVDENQCHVVAIGPRVEDQSIQPGAVVLVEKYDGRKVTVDGVEYIVMPEDEILGTYNTKEPTNGQEKEAEAVLDA